MDVTTDVTQQRIIDDRLFHALCSFPLGGCVKMKESEKEETGVVQAFAPGIWKMRFPLKILGIEVGRNVSVVDLGSGRLLIHSTAPFDTESVARIREIGEPVAMVDATCFHDTYAKAGCSAFPELPYFAPDNFSSKVESRSLRQIENICGDTLLFRELEGMPKVREHVCFHPASKTLIVADLCFNFSQPLPLAARCFFRYLAGISTYPGMSRMFRLMIRDRSAFERSLSEMLHWDFDRIIFAHGEAVPRGGNAMLKAALRRAGFLV